MSDTSESSGGAVTELIRNEVGCSLLFSMITRCGAEGLEAMWRIGVLQSSAQVLKDEYDYASAAEDVDVQD